MTARIKMIENRFITIFCLLFLFARCSPIPPEIKTERIVRTVTTYDQTVWPTVGKALSSPFGPRQKASEGFRYDFHRGIDIPGAVGEPIYAIADGEVYRTYTDPNTTFPNGGNVVILRHSPDKPIPFHGQNHTEYYSLYLHLDTIQVSQGDPVAQGAVIGTLGASGTTSFPHLHFEVRLGTTCSREYQISNPTFTCASYFQSGHQDPHVNPFLFLPYADRDNLTVTVIQESPLIVQVRSQPTELDFNNIRVLRGGITKAINLDQRIGIDPNNIDNNNYDGVIISPARFNTSSVSYEITFEFSTLSGFDSIEVTDLWGKGLKMTPASP